jgi:hypothetical protein
MRRLEGDPLHTYWSEHSTGIGVRGFKPGVYRGFGCDVLKLDLDQWQTSAHSGLGHICFL